MGKNTIRKIIKCMKENLPLQDMCSKERLSRQPLSPENGGQKAEGHGSSKIRNNNNNLASSRRAATTV